jgi:hypothetical protein
MLAGLVPVPFQGGFPMRSFFLAFAVACCTTIASAENVIVTTTTVVSAQETADDCARTGLLRHCRVLGGRREGIGFSTVSPEAAEKSACFYNEAVRGRLRIVERAVSWSPARRGWFAVLRYTSN